jgi:hypothetical protein
MPHFAVKITHSLIPGLLPVFPAAFYLCEAGGRRNPNLSGGLSF